MSASLRLVWSDRYHGHNVHLYLFEDEYPSRGGTYHQQRWLALIDGEDASRSVWAGFDTALKETRKSQGLLTDERRLRIEWLHNRFVEVIDEIQPSFEAFRKAP